MRGVTAKTIIEGAGTVAGAVLVLSVGCVWAQAADLSARDIATKLHKAEAGTPIDLTAHDLSNLDLAGLDFKAANLTKANLYGVDLSAAKLIGANLAGAKLDRAIVARADFSNANLEGASVLRPSVYNSLEFSPAETPKFAGR
jgi:uncharacterized protein YjbI with pentapeptide repeats